eukprot:5082538-Amphidinium_carterae.1
MQETPLRGPHGMSERNLRNMADDDAVGDGALVRQVLQGHSEASQVQDIMDVVRNHVELKALMGHISRVRDDVRRVLKAGGPEKPTGV